MLIAQISDFHTTVEGALAYDCVDTSAALRKAVGTLCRLNPRPDLILGTGDLAQNGTEAEYKVLREILKDLPAPFLPVMGNHDCRPALIQAFSEMGEFSEIPPFVQYVRDFGTFRIIVLDTVKGGCDEPEFCPERLGWLIRALSASSTPVILVCHHPFYPVGIPWLDPVDANWAGPIWSAIERTESRIIGILSGHVHRAIHAMWHDIPASTCPSTAHQVALDFLSERAVLSHEASGFQLHRIEGAGISTYTANFAGFFEIFAPSAVSPS